MKKMKRRTRWWVKLLIGLMGVVLVFFALIYFSFEGFLIKRVIVTHRAKEYVAEHFPDQGFNVDFAQFNWKSSTYSCDVWSETSVDTNFKVTEYRDGDFEDSYESRVTNRWATYNRLEDEAREKAQHSLTNGYPHKYDSVNCLFVWDKYEEPSWLELDMPLDMENPPFPLELYLSFTVQAPSAELMKERLRELPEIVDALNMNISYFSMSIYAEDEQQDSLHCFNVPREIVLSDQLDAYIDAELN